MVRWITELQEYTFTFLVENSTKATLADLLTYKDTPILVKEVEDHTEKVQEKGLEDSFTLFFDGSYRKSMAITACGQEFES